MEENVEELTPSYRYESGELVKVKNIPVGAKEGNVPFTPMMVKFIGETIEVRPQMIEYGVQFYEHEGWTFSENWLEPIDKKDEGIELIDIKLSEMPTKEDIEEMIKKVDVNTILKIFKARVKADGYSPDIIADVTKDRINKYLKAWAKSKYRFYKLFGKSFYLKKEIEIEKNNDWYGEKVSEIKAKFPLYSPILDAIHIENIRYNTMNFNSNKDFFEDKRVTNGMKFTKFMALYGNNDLNMEISKIYQDKASKEVVVSIDPVDYLTVSINKSWRSCHNFINGECRNAGLALMLDKTSLVAYTSCTDVQYEFEGITFEANNKNWREMLYLSETNSEIICSLQYPYYSDELSKTARTLLEDQLAKYLKVPNKWRVRDYKDISIDYTNMYNDIGRDGCKFIINKYDKKEINSLKTGAKIPAINNGRYYIEKSEEDLWT